LRSGDTIFDFAFLIFDLNDRAGAHRDQWCRPIKNRKSKIKNEKGEGAHERLDAGVDV
jgi:aminoglycoside phosphotransferase family enzyme